MSWRQSTLNLGFIWILSQLPLAFPLLADERAKSASLSVSFEPLLSQEFPSQMHRLLVLAALSTDSKYLEAEEAEVLWNKTQQTIKTLKNPISVETSKNLTLGAAKLLHYYLSHDVEDRIAPTAKWLETYAGSGFEAVKNPQKKAKFAYYQKLAQFYLSNGADGLSELTALRPQLKNSKALAANLDLLTAYPLASSPNNAGQASNLLNQAAPSLDNYGKIALKLIEASMDIGIDGEGRQTGTVKATYDVKLAVAATASKALPAAAQSHVLNTTISIWNMTPSSKENKIPNYLSSGFKSQRPIEALRERKAIALIKAQKYPAAIALYRTIAENLPDLALDTDKRIWDTNLLIYQKSNAIADLEKSYLDLRGRYRDEAKRKSSPAAGLWQSVAEGYRGVLDQLIVQANQAQTPAARKSAIVQTLVSYCKIENESPSTFPYKVKLAQLYRSLNQYPEATALYLELAPKDSSGKLLLAAIESQSQLAKWPQQPPFEGIQSGPEEERQKLIGIFERGLKTKGADEWFFLAHMGLLHRALGRDKAAEELWRPALQKAQGKFAMEASGILLTDFHTAKRWQDFIDLAHLCKNKKLEVMVKSKALDYAPWLADALFNGGSADLLSKVYPRAAKNLEEFVQLYGNDPRIPQAVHFAALAYVGQNRYTPALNACRTIAERYPAYPARPKLLLQAAEWALLDKSTTEFAIYFYTKYLADYKNEGNAPQVRQALAETYLKRKLYGWASRTYREQSSAANVSKEIQLDAAAKVMEIEEQFGEMKDAYWGAQRILQLASPQDPFTIRGLAFMGRYLAQSKELKGVEELEARLLPHVSQSKEALEALAQLRFRQAELTTQPISNNESNLQIRDPEATVKKYADRFDVEKQPYAKVCQIGMNTMCAPALWRLTSVAKQAMEAVQKVEIADTLGPSRVKSFNDFKTLYLNKLAAARKDLKEQALRLAKQGTTTESWREEINKSVDLDVDAKLAH